MQAWSDKINNVLLLALGAADMTPPPAVPAFTVDIKSTAEQGFISAIIQYPAQPSLYFVQARSLDIEFACLPCASGTEEAMSL
jgi:hypothetical protein